MLNHLLIWEQQPTLDTIDTHNDSTHPSLLASPRHPHQRRVAGVVLSVGREDGECLFVANVVSDSHHH
jgi:hypothetical protein